jgi:hypothetical protein
MDETFDNSDTELTRMADAMYTQGFSGFDGFHRHALVVYGLSVLKMPKKEKENFPGFSKEVIINKLNAWVRYSYSSSSSYLFIARSNFTANSQGDS